MLWMITVSVTGFLLGEPTLSFSGFYGHRFVSEVACDAFARSEDTDNEGMRLRKLAEAHLKDPTTKIVIEFKCVATPDGQPA